MTVGGAYYDDTDTDEELSDFSQRRKELLGT